MATEKTAVGKQTGGFQQTRKGIRPYRVDTLTKKQIDQRPSEQFEADSPSKPQEEFESSLAATAGEEFEKESAARPYRDRAEVYGLQGGKVVSGFYPDGSIGTFGGGIDPGETAAQAARREFKEEAGIKLKNVRPVKGAQPFVQEWPAGGVGMPAKHRERAKHYRGSRTFFFVGDVTGKKTRPIDSTKVTDVAPRPLPALVQNQELAIRYGKPHDRARIESRLGVLKAIGKQEKLKQAALRPRPDEFAPGIPQNRRIEKIPTVKEDGPNEQWVASLSKHPAAKRGDHLDLRLVDPKGRAHSFALNQMPKPGGSVIAAQMPTHTKGYAMRDKPFAIPLNVYGGTRPGAKVESQYIDPVEVVSANQQRIHLRRQQAKKGVEELVLRRVAEQRGVPLWKMHNVKPQGRLVPRDELAKSAAKWQDPETAFKGLSAEADPEKLVGRLRQTRTGRVLNPVLERPEVKRRTGRLRQLYDRLIKRRDHGGR